MKNPYENYSLAFLNAKRKAYNLDLKNPTLPESLKKRSREQLRLIYEVLETK